MIAIALLLAAASAALPVHWVQHQAGSPVPPEAVQISETEALYVCRAQMPDGVHPGETIGGLCVVPQKGKTETFDHYELAEGTAYTWEAANWEKAIIAGHQGRNGDLYVCRAELTAASEKGVFAGGKAYRTGTHAGHCYVAHEGREIDIAGEFELLVAR